MEPKIHNFNCPYPIESTDFNIADIGEPTLKSPIIGQKFIDPNHRVSLFTDERDLNQWQERNLPIPSLERAGPREKIYHDSAWARVGIVTCGGLCPGLNNVIKGLVQVLWFDYNVRHIFGIPYGYRGLNPSFAHAPIILNPEYVDSIHEVGGTILGSSRGMQDTATMVDTLMRLNINILFAIGGDGTLRGAHAIAEEVKKRNQRISVIGVPKTIDNDLNLIDRTFGFETAVYIASDIIANSHVEANGAYNGLSIVKLMGRDSGFIAAYASLANTVVNFCLIPEHPFELEGENGLFKALEERFAIGKTHAVLVVAEGSGQHLFEAGNTQTDASGNILHNDIGDFLVKKINKHFKSIGKELNIKYFDPSYIVRSGPAKGTDAIFCYQLAENAVHAAMAGKTDMVVGSWSGQFTHVPIELAVCERKKLDTTGPLWNAVLSATRQRDYGLR
ncbi:MAG: ATP-dependent 6-phosphofructokinase [Fibrobacter sp.]|nr:ATP-dependent 6-phosphofructokinase [Fibrobacter sp.]